ncbi:hypothetical protein J25TS5_15950 [Paenibacillus faecis]|nr:hypothetical protein J25TS5_15950 [Paenibacillus faecis]
MAAADTKFKAFADQLKEAGSALGAKFTNGLKPATNVGNINLDVPNVLRQPGTDRRPAQLPKDDGGN